MDQVRLPDLEVIKRFSIAVRREHADPRDVIEALEADLAAVRAAARRAPTAPLRDDLDDDRTEARELGASLLSTSVPGPSSRPSREGLSPLRPSTSGRAVSKTSRKTARPSSGSTVRKPKRGAAKSAGSRKATGGTKARGTKAGGRAAAKGGRGAAKTGGRAATARTSTARRSTGRSTGRSAGRTTGRTVKKKPARGRR